jgi:hypothetical protein
MVTMVDAQLQCQCREFAVICRAVAISDQIQDLLRANFMLSTCHWIFCFRENLSGFVEAQWLAPDRASQDISEFTFPK